MDLKEIGQNSMEMMNLVQDRDKWREHMNFIECGEYFEFTLTMDSDPLCEEAVGT